MLAAIANGLDSSHYTPVILVGKLTGSKLETQLKKKYEIREFNLRNPGVLRFISSLLNNIKIIRNIGGAGHSFDYSSDWFEALSFRLAGVPLITEKTNLSFSSWRWKFKLGLSSHIVCLSNAQLILLKRYQHKTTLIPTGVNVKQIANAVPVSRSAVGLQESDVVLISIAHYVEVKGYEELIEAAAELKNEFPNLKYLCVGTGDESYVARLRQLADQAGVGANFVFHGGTADVASLLKIADGKILATRNTGRREGFGAAIVEAMSASLPVIATRSGGPEDIIIENQTGWLVDANGSKPLVEGIRVFMHNKSRWSEVGAAGFKRAESLYNEEKMVHAYADVYSKFK